MVRNATQLERMRTVKPKMNISAKLLNTSGTVFEQGYLWELLLAPTSSGTFGPLHKIVIVLQHTEKSLGGENMRVVLNKKSKLY